MERAKDSPTSRPVVLDLFCGAGGLSLGFDMAGYQIGLGLEKEAFPCQTYSANFSHRCVTEDICKVDDPCQFAHEHDLDQIDVIIGGPPCQGFSHVGRGKMRSLRGDANFLHDPRNQYYREFLRFIKVLRPLYFVMENVPDMQFYKDGDILLLDKAQALLENDLGYEVEWKVLQADHYGVPQTRRRLFLIGNRVGHTICWPEKTHNQHPVTVWDAISDLPLISHKHRCDEILYEPRCPLTPYQHLMREGANELLYNHQTRYHNEQDLAAFAYMEEGGKYAHLPGEFKRYRDDIFLDKYRKLYRNRPSWTIEAHIGKDSYRYIYPSLAGKPEPPRTISVREAARLQSFPDRFRFVGPFTKQFHQVGNAVPPLLARAVAKAILPRVLASTAMERIATHEIMKQREFSRLQAQEV